MVKNMTKEYACPMCPKRWFIGKWNLIKHLEKEHDMKKRIHEETIAPLLENENGK